MFDKIKQKLGSSDSDNASTQQPNKSTPSINEPSSGTSTRHQSGQSVEGEERAGRLSVSEDRGRSSPGNVQARTASKSRSRSRARDVLWKNSLYNHNPAEATHKQDPNLRAKSLSVAAPHPTMAEEDMKRMPYQDWSKKN